MGATLDSPDRTLLFAVLTLPFAARPMAALPAMLLAFIAWAAIDNNYSVGGWRHSLAVGATTLVPSFTARLTGDVELPRQYATALESIATQQPLPSMPGSTDIYPYDQVFLSASRNTWSPRPVFQSHSAFTPGLADANLQHLMGPEAPATPVQSVAHRQSCAIERGRTELARVAARLPAG